MSEHKDGGPAVIPSRFPADMTICDLPDLYESELRAPDSERGVAELVAAVIVACLSFIALGAAVYITALSLPAIVDAVRRMVQ